MNLSGPAGVATPAHRHAAPGATTLQPGAGTDRVRYCAAADPALKDVRNVEHNDKAN
jgi:hypothetical protein